MSREQSIDNNIQTAVQEIPYPDQREIAGRLCRRMTEGALGSVTGAGGVGGSVLLVPFQPARIVAINALGATKAMFVSHFPDGVTAQHVKQLAGADITQNATPPTLTRVAANNWTVGLPTQMAPDGEVISVHIEGFRSGVDGSL